LRYAFSSSAYYNCACGPIDDYDKQLIMSIESFQISEDEEGRNRNMQLYPKQGKALNEFDFTEQEESTYGHCI